MFSARETIDEFKGRFCVNWLRSTPVWLVAVAVASLFLYSATRMTLPQVGSDLETVVVITGFFVWLTSGRGVYRSALFWLLLAAITVPLVSWGSAHLTHPQWAEASPKVHRLTHWFAFIPVAVWLGGHSRNVFLLWGIALLGLLTAPWLLGQGWSEWSQGLQGRRVDFNLHNAQHMGMLYGTALLGLVAFSRRIVLPWNRFAWIRLLCWALLTCFFGSAVILAQSRGVWLGLMGAVCCFVGVGAFVLLRRKQSGLQGTKVLLGVAVILTLILFTTPLDQIVQKRAVQQSATITKILEGDFSRVEYDSVGIRFHSWMEAWPWIKKRPFFGWGGHGRRLVIEQSEVFPEELKKNFGHLHNSYFDLLVSYGFAGLTVLIGLLVWLVSKSTRALKDNSLPVDFAVFGLLFLVFWMIVNCFESYLFYSSGGFIFSLVAGGFLNFIWLNQNALADAKK